MFLRVSGLRQSRPLGLYAQVLSTNPRSRRAFEKAGFELEGTFREDRWVGDRYVDTWWLGRLIT